MDNWSIEVSYIVDQQEHTLTLDGQPFDQMEGELVDTLAGNVTINGIQILSTRILTPLGGDELRAFITKCAKLDSNPITSLHLEQITGSSQKVNELLSIMTSLLSQSQCQLTELGLSISPCKKFDELDLETY